MFSGEVGERRMELKGKAASGIMLTLLFLGMLTLAFNIQPVKADGTIYIRADGSIDPSTAPISTVDNITYTFTGDIYDKIVVKRDNITIDGNGHLLKGARRNGYGITLYGRGNVTIKNAHVKSFFAGIYLSGSLGNTISGNSVTNNDVGILLEKSSSNNIISGNNITANGYIGIYASFSSDNNIIENNVKANKEYSIELLECSDNNIIGNNITNNGYGIELESSSNNVISGNNITNNWEDGILLFRSSKNNVISGNNLNGDHIGLYSSDNNVIGNNINNGGGISLSGSNINAIGNNINNGYGIKLIGCLNNNIIGNNLTNNYYGIRLSPAFEIASSTSLDGSFNKKNNIIGNKVTNNYYGIVLASSSKNNISGNIVTNNDEGIELYYSSNNKFYHNNFVNNTIQVYSYGSTNAWDDGYPSGGNYWSDYAGVDFYSGCYQNKTGSDGIGDKAYQINANNKDRYPLRGPIVFFDAGTWNGTPYNVDVISNSTVSSFQLNRADRIISFNITGPDDTLGFCRVTIPNIIVHDLWHGNYTVLLNGEPWPFRNWTDTENTYIYLNYTHTEHKIVIVPEFPSAILLPLFMVLSMLAAAFTKKRFPRKPKT